jgi:carboxymethylenebutenolidase
MGDITFAVDGATTAAYLALPPSGAGPAVVVVQEWWGLVGHIRAVVDRFAEAGFVALAPDFYHGAATGEPDEAQRLMMGLAMDRAALDIAGAADHLTSRDEVTGAGIGAVGFCMGGSLALWSATVAPQIRAAVGFYPAVPWQRMNPRWPNYAAKAAMIHCSEDDGTSAAPGIQAAVAGVTEAGGQVVVHDYPGTHHAFFNDERPEVYSADDSALAWQRTIDFLHSRLS